MLSKVRRVEQGSVQLVLVYPVVYNVVPIIEMDFESNAVFTLCVL